MLELLTRERRERQQQPRMFGVAEDQSQRRRGSLLLAVGVVEQDLLDVRERASAPVVVARRREVKHAGSVLYAPRMIAEAHTRRLATALLAASALASACMGPHSYSARMHHEPAEPPPVEISTPLLLSAHVSRFGDEPEALRETSTPRLVESNEHEEDRIVLLFARELDPLTIDPRGFGVLRADGQRVRPTRVFLAPADEGDENRSLTLTGNFGSPDAPPVAIHVLGELYAETGEPLQGLDAEITGPEQADRPLSVERLSSTQTRCPESRQVLRTYWTDALTQVGDADLAGIELHLADGRKLAPIAFDDQARREGDSEGEPAELLGPVDDNVLDLCVDADAAVVHVRFAAGLFADASGHQSAAADLVVPAGQVTQ